MNAAYELGYKLAKPTQQVNDVYRRLHLAGQCDDSGSFMLGWNARLASLRERLCKVVRHNTRKPPDEMLQWARRMGDLLTKSNPGMWSSVVHDIFHDVGWWWIVQSGAAIGVFDRHEPNMLLVADLDGNFCLGYGNPQRMIRQMAPPVSDTYLYAGGRYYIAYQRYMIEIRPVGDNWCEIVDVHDSFVVPWHRTTPRPDRQDNSMLFFDVEQGQWVFPQQVRRTEPTPLQLFKVDIPQQIDWNTTTLIYNDKSGARLQTRTHDGTRLILTFIQINDDLCAIREVWIAHPPMDEYQLMPQSIELVGVERLDNWHFKLGS